MNFFNKLQSMGGNYVSRLGGATIGTPEQIESLSPEGLEIYNQQKEAAKTAGMRELAARLSDAFAGRDIVGRAQEREKLKAPEKGTSLMQNVQWIMSKDPKISYQEALQIAKGGTTINLGDNQRVIDYSLKQLEADTDSISAQQPLVDKVSTAKDLLLGGDFETGYFQEKILPFKQMFESAGITVDENLGEQEFINSTFKFLIPRMREKGSGSTSDFEARTFEMAAPSFGKTTEGNLILMGTWLQTAERDKKLKSLKEKYFLKEGNIFGFDDYLLDLDQKGELPTIYQNFAEEQDVESAYKKGSLKDGDIIIYNGKLEVFRKDDITDN
jgi:hypothetical protein